jgi:hypothetical protein
MALIDQAKELEQLRAEKRRLDQENNELRNN